jgi:citrate lyase subunit beta / citryl-CoA lyase
MHPHRTVAQEIAVRREPRSWLFVPADSEKKITKAVESDADAIIFDLEDSVVPQRKGEARKILIDLAERNGGPDWWVRINPLASEFHKDDLELISRRDIAGIVLPKAESGADVTQLAHRTGNIPIHAIVTETAASLFALLSYRDPKSPLVAMSWGAEDLSAHPPNMTRTASSPSPTGLPARSAWPGRSRLESSPSTACSPTFGTARD